METSAKTAVNVNEIFLAIGMWIQYYLLFALSQLLSLPLPLLVTSRVLHYVTTVYCNAPMYFQFSQVLYPTFIVCIAMPWCLG
jgi:hypothetical protein